MLQIEGLELADSSASNTSNTARGGRIKQDAERRAATLLQEAQKRGGGSVVDGMGDLWGQLNKGLGVLDKVIKDDSPEEDK